MKFTVTSEFDGQVRVVDAESQAEAIGICREDMPGTLSAVTRRGGARANSGPKPSDGKRGDRLNVTIDADSAALLRSYGDGALSLGIRRAALLVEREVGLRDAAGLGAEAAGADG